MASTTYRIMAAGNYGGDALERKCWPLFLQQDFPSYETFWQKRVVPVTTRPHGMSFRSDAELAKISMDTHDMAIAQLHYTILAHLDVAYRYRAIHPLEAENFTHAIVRLSSATDVADEILGRLAQPGTYNPWSEADGDRARRNWRWTHQQLQDIRDYRNRLVHGRVFMSLIDGQSGITYFPKIGREQGYLDWRTVVHHPNPKAVVLDYASGHDILEEAWRRVVGYIETSWQAIT